MQPLLKDAEIQLLNLFQSGKFDEAERVALSNIKTSPEHLLSWKILGVIYLQKGLFKKSIKINKKIIEIDPSDAEGYCYLGSSYKLLGQSSKAIKYFLKAVNLKENYSDAILNLANTQAELSKYEDAHISFKKYIALNPENSNAIFQLGITLDKMEKFEEASDVYLRAYQLNYKNPELLFNLATSLMKSKKNEEALKFYDLYNSINSKNWKSFSNMAYIYFQQGKKDEAIKYLDKAARLEPNHPSVIIKSLLIKEITTQDSLFKKAYELFYKKETLFTEKQRVNLAFNIAKIYESEKDFRKAFEFYDRANFMARNLNPYDVKNDILKFDRIKKLYMVIEGVKPKIKPSLKSQIPIFILGMPRSGTSLIEQIITSHNNVYGAGELGFLTSCFDHFIKNTEQLDLNNLLRFRDCYLEAISQLSDNRFITDKLPHNFRLIGFIYKAIPEAKIIYVSRDPGAICWGNFKQNFAKDQLGYSNNLQDTVKFYNLHKDLMNFWAETYSREIIECNYDRLTNNSEVEIKNLINNLGLDWDENCLYPERNPKTVFTASNQQVKKKIYKNSSKSWEKFKPFLGNLFDELY